MRLLLERLGKEYRGGHWGLRGIDLELTPGVIGLLGPNRITSYNVCYTKLLRATTWEASP